MFSNEVRDSDVLQSVTNQGVKFRNSQFSVLATYFFGYYKVYNMYKLFKE